MDTSIKVYDTRNILIDCLLPKHSIGCEVGVLAGDFAEVLYTTVQPSYFLMVDPWELLGSSIFSGDQDGLHGKHYVPSELYIKVKERFKDKSNVSIVKNYSNTILPSLPDGFLDWIYIDGDHSFQGCYSDLIKAESKIRAGGYILCHDYEMNYKKCPHNYNFGVGVAVDTFCKEKGWKIVAKGMDGCVTVALQRR